MLTAASTVVEHQAEPSEHDHRERDGHDDGKHRATIGRTDQSQRGEPDENPEERDFTIADQDENHGSAQMRSDRTRPDLHNRHWTV